MLLWFYGCNNNIKVYIFRVVIGGVIGVATRAVFKPLAFIIACYILKEPNLSENRGGAKRGGAKIKKISWYSKEGNMF